MGTKPFAGRGATKGRTVSKSRLKGALPQEEALYAAGDFLQIEHVPTGYKVRFSAFIENFSDAYNSEWSAEQVYGRMDPIATYMHTRRALAVSWKIPASSFLQAQQNLDEIGKLVSFLYPVYTNTTGGDTESSVINMAPLVRVKFGNLIQNSETGGGLLGYLNGFTTDVDFTEQGVFSRNQNFLQSVGDSGFISPAAQGTLETEEETGNGDRQYFPRNVIMNFEMNVLHEHPMGWEIGAEGMYTLRSGKKGFPYGGKTRGSPSKGYEVRPRPRSRGNNSQDPVRQNKEKKALK
tara:strand:+ start:1978 stop:2856 length:879 start_codon:yes stop_codon:yes gene_type:complete